MEKRRSEVDWKTRAAKLFCIGTGTLALLWILSNAVAVVVVFGIAWAVAAVIDPLSRRTELAIKIPRKVCAAFYVILLLAGLGVLVWLAVSRLCEELEELAVWVGENRTAIGEQIHATIESIKELAAHFPFWDGTKTDDTWDESLNTMISGFVSETVTGLGSRVTSLVGNILRATPEMLILLIVTVMACFYLSMDYVRIRNRLIALLPSPLAMRADRFRMKASRAIRRYVRAYVLLLLLTFIEVFVGLLILGQRYAFLLAWLVALVDILPIVGAGTVLIPWAIVMLICKNYSLGFGLLILYGVITIVRQIAEPHIVGGSLGIHPLASLFFMFLGLELFGFAGMLLGPAAALLVKEFLKERTNAIKSP